MSPQSALPEPPAPRTERLGIYRVESLLGRGGMGAVVLAWDPLLERHVAIKQLRPDRVDARRRRRLLREARAVARLDHPAIVRIFHVLERDAGDCLVMEFVRGRDLGRHLADGPLEVERALVLAREIALGLEAAHGHGILHRDLKPANVMLDERGAARILDFGLAKAIGDDGLEGGGLEAAGGDRLGDALTATGVVVGTAQSMSPEQIAGTAIDERSDLFALGALLYEMLSGHAPFRGGSLADSLRLVATVDPPPVGARVEVPAALGALVAELLHKDPDRRPPSAGHVAARLASIEAALRAASPGSSADPRWVDDGSGRPPAAAPDDVTIDGGIRRERPGTEQGVPAGVQTLLALRWLPSADDRELARRLLAAAGGERMTERGLAEVEIVRFRRPSDAVDVALALQREAEAAPRIGIETREASVDGPASGEDGEADGEGAGEGAGDGEGRTAVRLAALARARPTLLSRVAFDLARGSRRRSDGETRSIRWLAFGAYRLADPHGLADGEQAIDLFEVGEEGVAPLEPPGESEVVQRALATADQITLGWRPAADQEIPRRPKWRLVERLARGGFGEVWLARHKGGEERAFKFCFEAEQLRALKREVTLLRLLRETLGHRSDIARLLDWDFDAAPYFLESDYAPGGDFERWAERRGGLSALPLATRLELVASVAEALAAAHSVGVLHKDVKPRNVLIAHDRDGRPQARLADFGIGRLTERERLEQPGFTVLGFTDWGAATGDDVDAPSGQGTVPYMAPELLAGKPATTRADVYALGVLLYQTVVGDFERPLAPGWQRDVDDPFLVEDVAACVDGAPERRLADAGELADRLRRLEERRAARAAREAEAAALRRRARRRRLLGRLSLLTTVVAILVSFFAFEAHRAKTRALEAHRQAEQRRQQAEDLLDFMLGDLRGRLEPIGQLGLLDAVGDQAMDYFLAVPSDELSLEELASHARALHQIGEVRYSLGRMEEAEGAFSESLQRAEALAARDPGVLAWRFELAQSQFWLGFLAWQRQDLEAAGASFERYLELAASLRAEAPSDRRYQRELAYAYSNLGSLRAAQDRLEDAEGALQRSLEIFDDLIASIGSGAGEDRTELLTEAANVASKLAAVARDAGDLEASHRGSTSSYQTFERAFGERPGDRVLESILVVAANRLAASHARRGEVPAAIERFTEAVERGRGLVAHDPENVRWRVELARNLNQLARLELLDGASGSAAWRRAEAHLGDEARLVDGLLAIDESRRAWRFARARSLWGRGLLAETRGEARRALGIYGEALATLDSFADAESPGGTERDRLWTARTLERIAALRERLGVAGAGDARDRALRLVEGLVALKASPERLELHAVLLLAAGEPERAEPIVEELRAMGWAHPLYASRLGLSSPLSPRPR